MSVVPRGNVSCALPVRLPKACRRRSPIASNVMLLFYDRITAVVLVIAPTHINHAHTSLPFPSLPFLHDRPIGPPAPPSKLQIPLISRTVRRFIVFRRCTPAPPREATKLGENVRLLTIISLLLPPFSSSTSSVLLGRGNAVNAHPGNVQYRALVLKYRDKFREAPKERKREVSERWPRRR